jgi:hypothetical protein
VTNTQKALRTAAKFLWLLEHGHQASKSEIKSVADLCWLNLPMKYRMTKTEIEIEQSVERMGQRSRRMCNECGKRKQDVELRVDPYDMDVNNVEVERWMCSSCYAERAADV